MNNIVIKLMGSSNSTNITVPIVFYYGVVKLYSVCLLHRNNTKICFLVLSNEEAAN